MSTVGTKAEKARPFYMDMSLWALIGSNLAVIAWALLERWPLSPLMWIYWCQSCIIGIFWFFKMLGLKEFSTKDFKINDRSVAPTQSTKVQTAVFFLVHYGFFHLGYFTFLATEHKVQSVFNLLTAAGIFFFYQGYSFFYNQKWLISTKPNIGKMMFFPYARIIPMHLTIIFASTAWGQRQSLALFLLLKLAADVIMHIVEQKGFSD